MRQANQEIKLPPLGENVKEGVVVAIMVGVGDAVEAGQTIIEVETDKVSMEVPCERSGTVEDILIEEGATISVGDPILRLEVPESLTDTETSVSEQREAEEEGTAEPEDLHAPSPESTVSEEPAYADRELAGVPDSNSSGPALATARAEHTSVHASPLARKLARDFGVDILSVPGSSRSGRVSVADVKTYVRQLNQHRMPASISAAKPLPDFRHYGPVRTEEMTQIRIATSRHVSQAWSSIPHAWLHEKADVTSLESHRQKHKQTVRDAGGSLTITVLLVKIVAHALRRFPRLNASLDVQKNEIIYKDYVHIGVAVDTQRGLLVPVVRNADRKNLTQIAQVLREVSETAREGKTQSDDLQGGTFTVSNLGGLGMAGITPLVNWPQVAILGVGASRMEQCYVDDAIVPRLMMPLTLGFDHRIIDGADGARFLQSIRKTLEDPFSLHL